MSSAEPEDGRGGNLAALGASVSVLLYLFLFWRVRRPDVAEVLAATPEE